MKKDTPQQTPVGERPAAGDNGLLLWVDDEIELLTPYLIYLKDKGYAVLTATNGQDALDLCRRHTFDLIFLDENMPGLSGIETLARIKAAQPAPPVVMVTKSEEENLMDQAIGSKIADYLIKPVTPNQILLTLKKHLHSRALATHVANSAYQQHFMQIGQLINCADTLEEWKELYKRLVYWELELADTGSDMSEMLAMQKTDANAGFAKFVTRHYETWLHNPDERPLMSPDVFKRKVFPALDGGEQVYLIVFDNLRYDQWRTLSRFLADDFAIDEELYLSILPTATQYARNAIFAGLLPNQIATMFPHLWVDEDSEEGKNLNEEPLIRTQLERYRRKEQFAYTKLNHSADTNKFLNQIGQFKRKDLNVIVVNFIDMLSHARTESSMVRELAQDENAYRSLTASWFLHSPIKQLFDTLAHTHARIILTTDHGSIRVGQPTKIIGDRNTNTNLRYKLGKNLSYSDKDVFAIKNPRSVALPAPNISTTYVFAKGNYFFAYPNNYNYYVSYYRDTFQHGGISLEEMLIPLVSLRGKHT